MRPVRREEVGREAWALAFSVLIHGLAALLAVLGPELPSLRARAKPVEPPVTVTFRQPFPEFVPPPAPRAPARPAPSTPPAGSSQAPARPALPPEPPRAAAGRKGSPQDRDLVPRPYDPPPRPADSARPAAPPPAPAPREVPLPPGGAEPPRTGPADRVPAPRPFDPERALRDFKRAQPPPSTDPGQGSGGRGHRTGLDIPDLPPIPSTGFSYGNLEFESRDYDWGDYYRQIYMIIWRAWHNRLYATTDRFERWAFQGGGFLLENQGRIRFTIEASGQVSEVAIEVGSGCPPLDDATEDTLREVLLPPLPRDFPRPRETVRYRFLAEGDVREMRRYLQAYKQAGYF